MNLLKILADSLYGIGKKREQLPKNIDPHGFSHEAEPPSIRPAGEG